MLNSYDQDRIERAQVSTIHSLEAIRDCLRDVTQMATPLRRLVESAVVLKSQSHAVGVVAPGSLQGHASAGNRGSR